MNNLKKELERCIVLLWSVLDSQVCDHQSVLRVEAKMASWDSASSWAGFASTSSETSWHGYFAFGCQPQNDCSSSITGQSTKATTAGKWSSLLQLERLIRISLKRSGSSRCFRLTWQHSTLENVSDMLTSYFTLTDENKVANSVSLYFSG